MGFNFAGVDKQDRHSGHLYTYVPPEGRDAWRNFLLEFEWDWLATLTARKERGFPDLLVHNFRHWINMINRKRFGPRWYKKDRGIGWVYGLETGAGGNVHIHALLAGVMHLDRRYWRDEWVITTGGLADIQIIGDTELDFRKVTYYVVKQGKLEFSRHLRDYEFATPLL